MLKKIFEFGKTLYRNHYLRSITYHAERDRNPIDQLHAALAYLDKGDLVTAYAFASAAAFKKNYREVATQAAALQDQIYEMIEPEKKLSAQNLAREYRNGRF